MLFKARFHAGIVDGSITQTFRRWKRIQVVPGHRYRQPFGEIEVIAVAEIDEGAIADGDVALAGYESRSALLGELARFPDGILYRIVFRFAGADRRIALREDDDLSEQDIETLVRRLARLDKASKDGAWTHQALDVISRNPAVVSTVLAGQLGLDRRVFKIHIRKLKEAGLTESLQVGYRLSPRGVRLLEYLRGRSTSRPD